MLFIPFLSFPLASVLACGNIAARPGHLVDATNLIFIPMILLVPLELAIIKWITGFGWATVRVYIWLVLAKILAIIAVITLLDFFDFFRTLLFIELFYSLAHFTVSFFVLSKVFNLQGNRLFYSSLLVSTLIPWLYSLSLWLLSKA